MEYKNCFLYITLKLRDTIEYILLNSWAFGLFCYCNKIMANVKIKCSILNVQCNYTSIKVCDKNFHQKYYIVLKAKHEKAITVKRVIFSSLVVINYWQIELKAQSSNQNVIYSLYQECAIIKNNLNYDIKRE